MVLKSMTDVVIEARETIHQSRQGNDVGLPERNLCLSKDDFCCDVFEFVKKAEEGPKL